MISDRMISRLDNLVAKYAYRDYYNTQKRHYTKIDHYSLSPITLEALEMFRLARKRDKLTPDEEAQVKAYHTRKIVFGELDAICKAEQAGEKYDPSKEVLS